MMVGLSGKADDDKDGIGVNRSHRSARVDRGCAKGTGGLSGAIAAAWAPVALMVLARPAAAHTSHQAFVLLLPTGFYTGAGVSAVVLTVVLVALPRLGDILTATPTVALFRVPRIGAATVTSLVSFLALAVLVQIGVFGPHDPLANPLPLFVWTIWWIGFVPVQALIGDLWHWVNPWAGPYRIVTAATGLRPLFELPAKLGRWPGILGLVLFAFILLAYPSPEDPHELAVIVGGYWVLTFTGMLMFGGEAWMSRCECLTILLRSYAKLAVFGMQDGRLRAGLPGWRIKRDAVLPISGALFVIAILGTSSFDGLNETFGWLAFLGVNPLEFPGRSAIIWQTTTGIVVANIVLATIFAACIYAGLALIGETDRFSHAFCRFSVTILPIAIGYHFAHFLPAFLVNVQHAVAAASDPLNTGADYLGLGTFYVSSGFFNNRDTVRVIFLAQAGAVVLGHIVSILAAHAAAAEQFGDGRKAALSQVPLVIFMIAYTFFGLWLLAAPRGA